MLNILEKNKTAEQLLELLADGEFHSGEDLGQSLGVTRSAIWKARKQLEGLFIRVESVSGKGYRVPGGIELLDRERVLKAMSKGNREKLKTIHILPVIDSTNNYLLNIATRQTYENIACLAECQLKGKGRRGRSWASPFGKNIYLSLLWRFNKDPAEIVGLSLAVAVATIRALKKYGIKDGLGVKWPNDIFWKDHKLGGVLLEMLGEPHGSCTVVIGVGLNTRIADMKPENEHWTDVETITKKQSERNKLAGLLIDELFTMLQQFTQTGLSSFTSEWDELDCYRDRAVTLTTENCEVCGVVKGIDPICGNLLLADKDGNIQKYLSGMSLRLVDD